MINVKKSKSKINYGLAIASARLTYGVSGQNR